jgi:serine/threonine-protein kinase
MIFGTPEYMAPEQAEGKEADHRVDVYAVGCIAYHLMTGNTPFVAENFMAMLTKHLMEDPVPPSVRRPDLGITPEMDALVLRALEKDRDSRYQTMGELLEAVTACHGPDQESARQSAAAYTREMGGAHAKAALMAEAPADRGSETEVVARGWEEAAEQEERAPRAIGRSGQKLILAAVGVVLGVAGALWFALSHNRTPVADSGESNRTARPSAPLNPPPAPAPVPAPVPVPQAVATPPATAAPSPAAAPTAEKLEASELRGKPGHAARGHKGKVGHTPPAPRLGAISPPSALPVPAEPAPAARPAEKRSAPPPPPEGLKPFPGM